MMKKITNVILLICLSGGINHLRAEENGTAEWKTFLGENAYATIGFQPGHIKGHTTYHISFDNPYEYGGHGESELEFPLDNFLLGIEAVFADRNPENDKQDKYRFKISYLTDLTDKAGKMKDSDWIEHDGEYLDCLYDLKDDKQRNDSATAPYSTWDHSGKDIYSESDARLDATILDFNYIYNYWPTERVSIGLMAGYRYQKFGYDIKNLKQVGFGPYVYDFKTSRSGNVLDYEVKYQFLYIGLNTDILIGDRFQLNLQAGYSDWVDAKDRDDHILRDLRLKGDCQGDARLINISADWDCLPDWTIQISGAYLDIDTRGKQYQYDYSEPPIVYVGIVENNKISSSSWIVSVNLKYGF